MLRIELEFDEHLAGLDAAIKAAVVRKMTELTVLAYNKVVENLSGKVLQSKTGQLVSSVSWDAEETADGVRGNVFISPQTAKAEALEFGGKSFYTIVPTKASILRFVSKSGETVFAASVNHPPSHAFRYLGLAADEMRMLVPEGLQEVIQAVIDGEV